jgi:tetratricopeptide (TPR) repeat protein
VSPRGRPLLAPALALGLACAGPAQGEAPSRGAAAARVEQGLALVARDDGASVQRAAELFQEALREDPTLYQARAHRAFLDLLVAGAKRDEASRLAPAEGDPLMQSGRDLRERALDELRPLVREHGHDPAVVRALAVYYGLDGNGPQTAKLVAQARARGSEPWIDFAELAADLRNGDPEAAVTRLAAFASSHPGLLRARMMLARAQLDRSLTEDALRTLDELLAANPRHEQALRLKAHVLSPPPARRVTVPVLQEAPPPQRPGHLPRKRNGAPAAPSIDPPASPAER